MVSVKEETVSKKGRGKKKKTTKLLHCKIL
jgi:hypothetical protein